MISVRRCHRTFTSGQTSYKYEIMKVTKNIATKLIPKHIVQFSNNIIEIENKLKIIYFTLLNCKS